MAKRGCDIAAEIASLSALDLHMLRQRWMECYGVEPGNRISRQMLIQAVAWRMQEDAHGGLGKTIRRQLQRLAAELHADGAIRVSQPQVLKGGSRLIREWKGKTHEVQVSGDFYLWQGKQYRSLSQIAREITGTRWSGPRFFGLEADGQSSPKAMPRDTSGDPRPPSRNKQPVQHDVPPPREPNCKQHADHAGHDDARLSREPKHKLQTRCVKNDKVKQHAITEAIHG